MCIRDSGITVSDRLKATEDEVFKIVGYLVRQRRQRPARLEPPPEPGLAPGGAGGPRYTCARARADVGLVSVLVEVVLDPPPPFT